MHLTLISEGKTEVKALHEFLKRWLDSKMSKPVRLKVVKLEGWSNFVKEIPKPKFQPY